MFGLHVSQLSLLYGTKHVYSLWGVLPAHITRATDATVVYSSSCGDKVKVISVLTKDEGRYSSMSLERRKEREVFGDYVACSFIYSRSIVWILLLYFSFHMHLP